MMTLIAFLLLLGIAVNFHEFGHFIVAKLCKIRVERFSFGFPPRLFGIKIGETDYCVSAFPFGGYVKVTGQDPSEPISGAGYEFNSKPVWQRMAVVFAGPGMNFISAYLLIVLALMIGISTLLPVIDVVTPNSPAEKAGFLPNDVLVSVNDAKIQSPELFVDLVFDHKGKDVKVGVKRDKQDLFLTMTVPEKIESMEDFGLDFKVPAIVGVIQPNKPAYRAGIEYGDEIIEVNGEPTLSRWQNVSKFIRAGKGKPLSLTILRKGVKKIIPIVPEYNAMEKSYLIGITPKPYTAGGVIRYPLNEALVRGYYGIKSQFAMFYFGISQIFAGKIPVKEALGGPQSIAAIAGQYFQMSFAHYLMFISAISISLGILNLLPVPVLDGGLLLFLGIEAVRRKPVPVKIWEISNRIGFALLMTLMIYVILNDFIGSGVMGHLLAGFR